MNILFKYIGVISAICAFNDAIAATNNSADNNLPLTRQYSSEEIADKTRFYTERFEKTKQFIPYFRKQVVSIGKCPMVAVLPNPQEEVNKISANIEPSIAQIEQLLEQFTPDVIAEGLGSGNEADIHESIATIDKLFFDLKKTILEAKAKFGCQ